MMHLNNISTYISRAVISIALILPCLPSSAQNGRKRSAPVENGRKKPALTDNDTIPLFRGIAVSADLAGPIMMAVSDYGQYEAAVKVNLRDKYFPTFELGYGKADHNDGTSTNYKTSAPYFRIGCDFNILKNKHAGNRLFVGFRYAYTSYKTNINRPDFADPVWGWNVTYNMENISSSYQWLEAVFGVDAKIVGPLHLGWTVRYRHRITSKEGDYGKSWYVPGFGVSNNSRLGGTFNVIIDI